MSEPEAVRALRRQLGQRLAAARKDAGYTQREFAYRTHYARSTLSTVESGIQHAGRAFWEACDSVLGARGEFTQGYDQLLEHQAAEREAAPADRAAEPAGMRPDSSPVAAGEGLRATGLTEALAAYRALGWPVAVGEAAAAPQMAELELVTGTILDALEVPRAAGILAATWWERTGGGADQIRGLPALPDPGRSLTVIARADQYFFLAAAGSYPWAGPGAAGVAGPPERQDAPTVRWHSSASQIPAPPSTDHDGRPAAWAYLPTGEIQLPSPVMLLDLLAKATAVTWHHPGTLTLPGGVLAVPALSPAAPPGEAQ